MKARQASFARCTPVDIIAGGHDDHITAKLSDTSEVSIHSDAMCAEMLLWISRIETDSGPRCAHAWRQDYRESPRCFGILGLFLSPGLWCRVLGLSLSLSLPGMRTGQSPRASCPPEVFSGRRGRKTNLSLSLSAVPSSTVSQCTGTKLRPDSGSRMSATFAQNVCL